MKPGDAYDALPPEHWPAIASALAQPWPREACLHDLRYHAARHALHGEKLPSLRELSARWGPVEWGKDRIARMIKANDWIDASRPWFWTATGARQGRDSDATPDNGSTPVSDAERDSGATGARQESDSRALLVGHPTPNTQEGGTRAGGAPLSPGAARGRPSGELVVLSQPWGDSHQAVWAAWRSWPAGAALPEVCPDSQRAHIRRALLTYTAEQVTEVFRWLAEADDQGATAFRSRTDWQVLAVILSEDRLPGRVLSATRWVASGRPKGRDALASAAGRAPRRGSTTLTPAARLERAKLRGAEAGVWMADRLSEGKLQAADSDYDATPESIKRGHGLATIEEAEAWLAAYRAELASTVGGGAHAQA